MAFSFMCTIAETIFCLPTSWFMKVLEKLPNLLPVLALEKLRAGRDQRVDKADIVLSRAAPRFLNVPINFLPVAFLRLNQVVVVLAACQIHERLLAYTSIFRS